MSDHCEEQEMEAEALAAIFDTSFSILSDTQPFEWSVKLLPVDCDGDDGAQNHVGILLKAHIPLDYPEVSLPQLHVEIIKGLTEEHRVELEEMAITEASNNQGMPAIYAICEVLREWLADHNTKGLDDASMHAQMIRRAQEEERKKASQQQEFESQKQVEIISQAEQEEQLVLKRRAEGTSCNKENFLAWKCKFEEEMQQQQQAQDQEQEQQVRKGKEKKTEDKSGRLTGFQQFSNKAMLNMEAIEAAAEQAENDEIDPEELNVEEELFDDDEDLDDLDFDDDDSDDEDEPDI
jgi:hypothetical protein